MSVDISDHAVLRFLERVKGIDMALVRQEMSSRALDTAVEIGAPCVIGRNGERLVIRKGVVVTVLAKGRYAGKSVKV